MAQLVSYLNLPSGRLAFPSRKVYLQNEIFKLCATKTSLTCIEVLIFLLHRVKLENCQLLDYVWRMQYDLLSFGTNYSQQYSYLLGYKLSLQKLLHDLLLWTFGATSIT